MTNFFNTKPPKNDRVKHLRTLEIWMWGRTHLPKDVVVALQTLIPDLKLKAPAQDDDFPAE